MESVASFKRPLVIGGGILFILCGGIAALFLFTLLFNSPPPMNYQESTRTDRISNEVKFAEYINEAAAKYPDVGAGLIAAIIRQESNFDPYAVSSVGAQGLMQLMPKTQAAMGVRDPFDPRQNILGGTKYLDKLLKKYNGDLQASLAAYNAGPGNVDRSLRETGNAIPAWLPETQEYVPSVLNHLAYYEKLVENNKLVIPDFDGTFGWPTDPAVSPGCGMDCYPGHTGQDFPAPPGTPIFSAGDGVVKKVETPENNSRLGPSTSYGTYVVIDHGDGYSTLYAHMYPEDIFVSVGDQVKKGQKIGLVGNYGRSTGPHLHFEIRKDNKPQDPLKYLKN